MSVSHQLRLELTIFGQNPGACISVIAKGLLQRKEETVITDRDGVA